MNRDELVAALPRLKPMADAWAEAQQTLILATGRALDEAWTAIARSVGVRDPSRVRILNVPAIPKPEDPDLLVACEAVDFLGPDTVGLTLFRGIYLVEPFALDGRLRAHELRHVAQYEEAGSIPKYLDIYLPQLLASEKGMAPLEIDARQAATVVLGNLKGKFS